MKFKLHFWGTYLSGEFIDNTNPSVFDLDTAVTRWGWGLDANLGGHLRALNVGDKYTDHDGDVWERIE